MSEMLFIKRMANYKAVYFYQTLSIKSVPTIRSCSNLTVLINAPTISASFSGGISPG